MIPVPPSHAVELSLLFWKCINLIRMVDWSIHILRQHLHVGQLCDVTWVAIWICLGTFKCVIVWAMAPSMCLSRNVKMWAVMLKLSKAQNLQNTHNCSPATQYASAWIPSLACQGTRQQPPRSSLSLYISSVCLVSYLPLTTILSFLHLRKISMNDPGHDD